ncbi:hypothetical protein BFP76_02515 [Amylibacter kogurei]|uniref:Abasic site processing protein n=2 Tax=Paramylibacter kogurei TaxID=1889778 RepID=A0A2G5K521_9RHOB|nr:hypothetical protein BFP76_02515 [Amylibacter kogurei]
MCGAQISGHMTWAEIYSIQRAFLENFEMIEMNAPPADLGYNIRPTQQVRMATLGNGAFNMSTARWWFVPDSFHGASKDWKATTFNARIETASDKPTFSKAWKNHRCVIPAIGYYEWTGDKGNKQPWFIAPKMNEPFFWFAGLYSERKGEGASCTILTRPALKQIEHIHARSPVMLSCSDVQSWLENDHVDREVLGTTFENRMQFHTVKPIKPKDDGESLIEPYDPPAQMGFAF